jgi:murein DD-endopeptidase MepM/ murein hydrolase activator NlpD
MTHIMYTIKRCRRLFFSVLFIPLTVLASGTHLFFDTTKSKDGVIPPEVIPSGTTFNLPTLSVSNNANLQLARGGAELSVYENALVSGGPVGADQIAAARQQTGEISVYVVRPGDSLSQIAEMFDVTTNTILWANDLPSATAIRPGDTLVILPVAGVRHIVKAGDTLSSVAKRYEADADEILSYNQLASAEAISIGMTLIVPGGNVPAPVVSRPAGSGVSATNSATGGNWLSHPAPGTIKTQGIHGFNAVDFAASVGTPIRAAAAGEVIVSRSSGWNGGYGHYIVIRHSNGVQTLYAHLSRNDVGVGAYVTQGQVIGAMGNTGRSTGPHLHFEVRGARNPF